MSQARLPRNDPQIRAGGTLDLLLLDLPEIAELMAGPSVSRAGLAPRADCVYEPRFPFSRGRRSLAARPIGVVPMAVPRRKTSPSRRGMRRSADALKAPTYIEDKDSGELRRPHHIDLKSGMYRGRQVLKPKKPAGEA